MEAGKEFGKRINFILLLVDIEAVIVLYIRNGTAFSYYDNTWLILIKIH